MNRNTLINLCVLLTLTFTSHQNLTAQGNSNKGIDKALLGVHERVVRYAYRKIYTYGLAGSIDRNKFIKRIPDDVAAKNSIKFELRNFQIGPIEQIKKVRIFDLASPPVGEIIQLSPTDTLITDIRKKRAEQFFSLTAQWVNGQYASGMDKNFTLEEVMRFQPARFAEFETFAVYEVTVFLEGKTRTYRAFALFPSINRSSKIKKPEFFDNIVGLGGAITNIFKEFKEPKGFVRQKMNKDRALHGENDPVAGDSRFADDNTVGNRRVRAVSPDEMPVNYFTRASYGKKNSRGGCFLYDVLYGLSCSCVGVSPLLDYMYLSDPNWDWTFLDIMPDDAMCLVPSLGSEEISGGGSGPLCEPRHTVRPGVLGLRKDNAYHQTGEHYGNVMLSGSCFQDERCSNICQVLEQVPPSVGETGDDTEMFYYHQGAKSSHERTTQGGKDVKLDCDRSVAYAFSRCLSILGCNVTATISINGPVGGEVSFAGGNLWNGGFTLANQCLNGQ